MEKSKKTIIGMGFFLFLLFVLMLIIRGCSNGKEEEVSETVTTLPTYANLPALQSGDKKTFEAYAASDETTIDLYDENCLPVGTVVRGTVLECAYKDKIEAEDGTVYYKTTLSDGQTGYVRMLDMTQTAKEVVRESTMYVRTAMNLLVAPDSYELGELMEKETELTILGFDELKEDGSVRMYQVTDGSNTGYMRPWYLTKDASEAAGVYSEEIQAIQEECGDAFGGGDAADLDYWPREKQTNPRGMEMPETVKALYVPGYPAHLEQVDEYIELADSCDVNAIVVVIMDSTVAGSKIAYDSDVVREYSPSTYEWGYMNDREDFAEFIKKFKDAGYYVIGRMTTFTDNDYVTDHPEDAICYADGTLCEGSGNYWPTAFSRTMWQYKLELAVEAVELFDLDEIQFDYVRFPDGIYDDSINFHNTWNESRAQAIQRFLMYATDALHELGVYVAADVFGETANAYVAPYGQYWPAMSNVVDVMSAMPYPDHYSAEEDYYPWEHPYETLSMFASGVAERQKECSTPAVDRTWIQCYDSIYEPFVEYRAENVGKEIQALFDNGLTGGYMTWNVDGELERYQSCIEAFNLDP